VSVILLESSHTREARQGTRKLVSVQHAKVGHPPGQLLVRDVRVGKNLAVARAVHGLEAKLLLLDLKREHVLLVVGPMARRLPQVGLVHVGRHDLDEAAGLVLALDKLHEGVEDSRAVGKPERGTGGHFVPEEELLVLTDLAVVALGSLGQEHLVLFELLLVRERDAGNSLNGLVFAVTKPVRGGVLNAVSGVKVRSSDETASYPQDGKGLDVARMRHVRPSAQVDEGTTSVHRALGAVGHALVDEVLLVLAVSEHLEELVLGHLEADERLLLLDDGGGQGLEGLFVLVRDGGAAQWPNISGHIRLW